MTEDTDQSGFHVSGWKSLMDKLSRPTSWVSPSQKQLRRRRGGGWRGQSWQQSEMDGGGTGVYQSFVLGLKRPLGVIM